MRPIPVGCEKPRSIGKRLTQPVSAPSRLAIYPKDESKNRVALAGWLCFACVMLSESESRMLTRTFPSLAAASIAANFSDQMMLALMPLILVAAGASAQTVSAVVAAHAAAWLVVSLPVGAYADAMSRRTIMTFGALAILAGGILGAASLAQGFAPPWLLACTAFIIAAGVVMLILSVFALVPKAVARERLPGANAILEFGRALACIVAPYLAAYCVARGASAFGFVLAILGGIAALLAARQLPVEPTSAPSVSLIDSIRDGAAFVLRQPILRAIAICAIAWNSAFFALTAVLAPYAANELGMSIEEIGRAWSVYGIGLLLGSLAAAPMIARLPTSFMFVFGPATSCAAVAVLVLAATREITWPVSLALFGLGFGPMTWLVLQTSVRQIVTPPELLGRVGATITTTIYGVRPLGALLAGVIAAAYGARAALWLSVALFVVSCIALVMSPAARLREMPTAAR
jgi:predicted MFS family arabinose efflux permease